MLSACTLDRSGLRETDIGVDLPTDLGQDGPGPDLGNPCTMTGTRFCRMGTLYECQASGAAVIEVCDHGCSSAGARCAILDVVHLNDNNDSLAMTGSLDLVVDAADTVAFDTDFGTVTVNGATIRNSGTGLISGIYFTPQSQPQGGFSALGVFGVRSLQIESGGRLIASGDRPFVLVVGTTASIDGEIDVGGGDRTMNPPISSPTNGPGGGVGGIAGGAGTGQGGAAFGTAGSANGGGGGGGGHNVMGARGGDESPATNIGGTGGAVIADPNGTPLAGGGGGGGGFAGGSISGGRGGGGGGAIQITAGTSITVGGVIRAPGSGGLPATSTQGAGGGGGAGGTILLQSPSIVLATGSAVVANGGGGAGADGTALAGGNEGDRGVDGNTAAPGGAGVGSGGTGGTGGFGLAPGGMMGGSGTGGGAGGGGAAGRLHFMSEFRQTSGTLSPNFTTGSLTYR